MTFSMSGIWPEALCCSSLNIWISNPISTCAHKYIGTCNNYSYTLTLRWVKGIMRLWLFTLKRLVPPWHHLWPRRPPSTDSHLNPLLLLKPAPPSWLTVHRFRWQEIWKNGWKRIPFSQTQFMVINPSRDVGRLREETLAGKTRIHRCSCSVAASVIVRRKCGAVSTLQK